MSLPGLFGARLFYASLTENVLRPGAFHRPVPIWSLGCQGA